MKALIVVFVSCVAAALAAKLPSYFTPRCSRSSPDAELSACAQALANAGLPQLANGEKKFHIPSMRPLIVPRMSLAQGTNQVGLNLTWAPAEIWGLDESKISNVKMSWATKKTALDILIPRFTLAGHYTSAGRVLLLPIRGEGSSNITVQNLRVHYEYEWPLRKAADGKEYCTIVNESIGITGADGMTCKFQGLFNGDPLLGNQMNLFLNENWRELIKELGPGMAEATGRVVRLVVQGLADHVPINDMFGP